MITDEANIVARAQKGSTADFTLLVEAYQRPVYNLCYRMLGNAEEAEDAAQETFLRAYHHLKRYDSGRPFSTWLLSIAAHYCIDQVRKRRLTLLSLDDEPDLAPPDLSPGPEAALSTREEQRRIQALLSRLNPQDRAVITLRYWNELSYEEIAQALSLTVSAVKSRLHRARLELAQNWTEQEAQTLLLERKRHESPAF